MTAPLPREPESGRVPRRRLFFALWPDDGLRSQISERFGAWLPRHDGRALAPDQWHVTLVFVGSVDEPGVAAVRSAGASISARPFELCFDRIEHWRKAQVVCLVASRTPEAALGLVHDLEQSLAAHGIEFDQRPYRPHATLARKVRRSRRGAADPVLVWPASEFALVESTSTPAGSRYEPLVRYRLTG